MCAPPDKSRWERVEGVKIFLISWGAKGYPMRGRVIFCWGRPVDFPSIFSFWDARFKKFKKILPASPSFIIFTFSDLRSKTDAGTQVDIDFDTEYNFHFSRSSFFSPLSGHSKTTKPMKLLSFLSIWRVPPNHPVSKARAFPVKVNKHGSYKSKSKVIFL